MKYNTKQKKIILDYLKENANRHLTIEEMQLELTKQNTKIGQATLYRYLDYLTNNGEVRKYNIDKANKACFQYINNHDCNNHFHLICTKCKRLIHLHCDEVDQFISHISAHHDFEIDIAKVVYYGLCSNCRRDS